MSEIPADPRPNTVSPAPRDATRPPSSRSAVRLLAIALAAVVVGALVVVGFGFFDGTAWVLSWFDPPLVSAGGQVLYHGTPLDGAQITTLPANRRLHGAIGWTDSQGRFTLQTDLDGYVNGAYAGEHQVIVTAYERLNVPAAPPLVTPGVYASFATTPLQIVVAPTGNNEYVFDLQGDPPPRPAGRRPTAPRKAADQDAPTAESTVTPEAK